MESSEHKRLQTADFNTMAFWKYPGGLLAFLLCVTYYYYNGAIDNYFAVDDYWFLMLTTGDVKTVLFGAPTLRLFGNIVFWINYKLFGFNHTGYNVVSIAIHCVNVMLVYFLIRRLFYEEKMAFLSAAIYAAMSVYCDAILYKAAILTLTNLTFYCIVLILYLKSREKSQYYIWSLMIFFLALFNKEEIASIPFVILLIELTRPGKFDGWRPAIKKVLPYGALIVVYIATMLLLSQMGILSNEQFERLSKFRLFHSLFGGFTSFFAKPDGFITGQNQLIACSILILGFLIAWFVSRKRKILIFGIVWVFLTFLPQSYSNLSQFNPKYLFNSISRHLYIPSVGVAIVIASIVLYSFREERRWLMAGAIFVLIAGLVGYNAPLAQERSITWGREGVMMRLFLHELKFKLPDVEKGAYIEVDRPFAGRSYMARALKAFYHHDVVYVDDPSKIRLGDVPALYFIENRIGMDGGLVVVKVK